MTHPIHYLSTDSSLRPEDMEELAKNCSSSEPDPNDPARTVFTFLAGDINDFHDRVIVADPLNGQYTMARPPMCVCDLFRAPIECQCWAVECDSCKRTFTAIESTCDDIYCLFDECPLCTHQREVCHSEEIEASIMTALLELKEKSPESLAASHLYGAIAEVLGAESGDAPNYPVVRRILGKLLGGGPDDEEWMTADGSVIRVHARQPAWLDY